MFIFSSSSHLTSAGLLSCSPSVEIVADEQRRKKNLDARRCEENNQEEFGFDLDVYSEEWFDRTHKYTTPAHQDCKVFGDCKEYNEELEEIRAAEAAAAAAAAKEAAEKAAREAQKAAEKAAKENAKRPSPSPRPAPRPSGGQPWWWSF